MNESPFPISAPDQLVEQWAARIAKSSGMTVEGILMQAENVASALRELRPYGPKARRMLERRSRLSRPMMSKLETIGRHAELLRLKANRLPASMSSLYALARMPWQLFLKAIETDLRGVRRADISRLFASTSPKMAMCKLMTISVGRDVDEAARRALIADIKAALMRVSEDHDIDLQSSSSRKHADN